MIDNNKKVEVVYLPNRFGEPVPYINIGTDDKPYYLPQSSKLVETIKNNIK